jgi:tetratricopeptide (TPR) repeat protein
MLIDPIADPDRREVLATILGGADQRAVSAEALSEIGALEQMIVNLALIFDQASPLKIGKTTAMLQANIQPQVIAYGQRGRRHDTKRDRTLVAYAQLLTMSATAASALGCYDASLSDANLAASVALSGGSREAAAHAKTIVACAHRDLGRLRQALRTARRAAEMAPGTPAADGAWLTEASIGALLGQRAYMRRTLGAADEIQASLKPPPSACPGYSLGWFHPVRHDVYASESEAAAGYFSKADARLERAGAILTEQHAQLPAQSSGAMHARILTTRASIAVATGDLEAAFAFASSAVEIGDRPGWQWAWVGRRVAHLARRLPGAFEDLARVTNRWRPVREQLAKYGGQSGH